MIVDCARMAKHYSFFVIFTGPRLLEPFFVFLGRSNQRGSTVLQTVLSQLYSTAYFIVYSVPFVFSGKLRVFSELAHIATGRQLVSNHNIQLSSSHQNFVFRTWEGGGGAGQGVRSFPLRVGSPLLLQTFNSRLPPFIK